MKKVLIVSYYFPPLNNIAAKRFGTMCKYFEKYGYETYVLTTRPHPHCFGGAKMDLEVPIQDKRIIRIGRTGTAYKPASVWAQLILQEIDKRNLYSRALTELSLGWYEKVRSKLDVDSLIGMDIVIGTYPGMENLFIASYLSRKLKCPFVAEIRDLITEYSEDTGMRKRSFRIDSIVERLILQRASGIAPVTCGFRDILRKKYPDKQMRVIFNGWENGGTDTGNSKGNYLYYAGSLYAHRLESFELLMRCMKRVVKTMDIRMLIRSVGPRGLDEKMRRMIQDSGMEQYIEIREAAEEHIIREEQDKAYMNVVLSSIHPEDSALMTTVPGKLYEVLRERAPVLAVVPENSDMARIIKKTDKGIATISEEKMIEFIRNGGEGFCGNKYVNFFSRKKQAERYCKFLDSILDK